MVEFTPVTALLGGAMIGAASALLMLLNGRIAGISGILGSAIAPDAHDRGWRVAFLLGLIAGASVWFALPASHSGITVTASTPVLLLAGVLVGVGTRIGSGCTSGHGICGIARVSKRSFAATAVFMVTAIITVFLVRHALGGQP